MELLFSNILPLSLKDGQRTILEAIIDNMQNYDIVNIAVGYISSESVIELDRLVTENNIKHISLIVGMYYYDVMTSKQYRTLMDINNNWIEKDIGEIRIINSFKYHGKLYLFQTENQYSAIVGSANLSVLKTDADTNRQYESAVLTNSQEECNDIYDFINDLKDSSVSKNINDCNITVSEENKYLKGLNLVLPKTDEEVEAFKSSKTNISFDIPLKVPSKENGYKYSRSNLNACYSNPRKGENARRWFETQITVGTSITSQEGYPERGVPFYVITDDGYWFKAHTTSDNNKQFSAQGNEAIMGRWIKGRLVASGILKPISDVSEDEKMEGLITQDILDLYGRDFLTLTKTNKQYIDEGETFDVWLLSFESLG